MRLVVLSRGPDSHSYEIEKQLVIGARQHAGEAKLASIHEPLPPAEVYALWGARRDDIIKRVRDADNHVLIMERGYLLDRFKYYSCTLDGLNGHGTPLLQGKNNFHNTPGVEALLKPNVFNKDGYILVLGQVPNDASVAHVNYKSWCDTTVRAIRNMTDKPICWRAHPLDKTPYYPDNVIRCLSTNTLEQDASGAKWCVTFNSNSAVDVTLMGVPCIVMDKGSMAYKVTEHHLNAIMGPPSARNGTSRLEWLSWLVDCQWTAQDFTNGKVWLALLRELRYGR